MIASGFYPRLFGEITTAERAGQLLFNDLRGTAVTLLAEAGVAIAQICAVTGHTLQSAAQILERYMARTSAMSRAAIQASENSPPRSFANRLQTGPQPGRIADKETK